MAEVWMLQHVSHAIYEDGAQNLHTDEDGNLRWDEQDGDDIKLIGVYSTEEGADQANVRASNWPGFRDEQNCFIVTPVDVDEDCWTEGFLRLLPGDVEVRPRK